MIQNPCVVGYRGQIGKFILAGLLDYMPKASDIHVFDLKNEYTEMVDRIKRSDYIFLCVPMEDTIGWLTHFRQYLKDKIIVEQSSLKSMIHNAFTDLKFVGMHILFRPENVSIPDRRCAIINDETGDVADFVKSGLHCDIISLTSAEEHDIIMSYEQALVHRVVLSLSKILEKNEAQTYIGGEIIRLAKRIRSGNKSLYEAIQKNPKVPEVVEVFKNSLDQFSI